MVFPDETKSARRWKMKKVADAILFIRVFECRNTTLRYASLPRITQLLSIYEVAIWDSGFNWPTATCATCDKYPRECQSVSQECEWLWQLYTMYGSKHFFRQSRTYRVKQSSAWHSIVFSQICIEDVHQPSACVCCATINIIPYSSMTKTNRIEDVIEQRKFVEWIPPLHSQFPSVAFGRKVAIMDCYKSITPILSGTAINIGNYPTESR